MQCAKADLDRHLSVDGAGSAGVRHQFSESTWLIGTDEFPLSSPDATDLSLVEPPVVSAHELREDTEVCESDSWVAR
jgi:hypothetical protein